MRIYVAGKVGEDLTDIQKAMNAFREAGHQITYDWTTVECYKPYLDNVDRNMMTAHHMLLGVDRCDVFVLLAQGEIYGAMTEFGLATAHPRPIIVVADENTRQSVFFCLSSVTVVDSVEEAIELLDVS